MCVGNSSQKEPVSNKMLAKYSTEQLQRHQDLILPLELQEIEQLQDEDYQQARRTILEGRANADAAASELVSQQGLRSQAHRLGEGNFTTTGIGEGNITSASQDARTKGVLQGTIQGAEMTLKDRMGALNTGQGHSRGVISGLSQAARSELAIQEAKARGDQALGEALGGLAMTAGIGGYTAAKRAGDDTVPYDSLSPVGKGLRKVFGPSQTHTFHNPDPTGTQVGPMSYAPQSMQPMTLPGQSPVLPQSVPPGGVKGVTGPQTHTGPSMFSSWI